MNTTIRIQIADFVGRDKIFQGGAPESFHGQSYAICRQICNLKIDQKRLLPVHKIFKQQAL